MIGESLLHYRIISKLGGGGMGIVYLAEDTKLGRQVAIKVINSAKTADPKVLQRLQREARAAASLNHPNIVSIYEVAQDRGTDFIVMEHVDGQTLSQILTKGALPLADALTYGTQMASALTKAHSQGIVHRDLKPSNALVNNDGLIKLVDFGLAQMHTAASGEEMDTGTALTESGMMLGTAQYMSPEQINGEMADRRADIFSFGVVMYQMLTGQRPFAAPSPMIAIHNTLYVEPERIEKYVPGLAPELVECVHKCMQKKRENRYQSMDEVLAVLKPQLQITMSGLSGIGPIPQPPLKKRAWFRMAIGAAALLVLSAASLTIPAVRNLLLRSSLAGAIGLPNSAAQLIREGDAYLVRFDLPDSADKAMERYMRVLDMDRGNVTAFASLAMAYAQKYAGSPDPQLLQSAQTYAAMALEKNSILGLSHVAQGRTFQVAGKLEDAETELRRAVDLDPGSASGLLFLGLAQMRLRKTVEAEKTLNAMIQTHPNDWRGHLFLANLLHTNGRRDEALVELEKADKIVPDNIAVLKQLGTVKVDLGQLNEAAAVLQKALSITGSTETLAALGDVYFKAGRYPDAADVFSKAVQKNANVYYYWGNLADSLRFIPGREAEANEAYEQGVRLVEFRLEKSPQQLRLHAMRALYASYLKRTGKVKEDVDYVMKAERPDNFSLFYTGVAAEQVGMRREAITLLRSAIAAKYSIHELETHPDLVKLRMDPAYRTQILAAVPNKAN